MDDSAQGSQVLVLTACKMDPKLNLNYWFYRDATLKTIYVSLEVREPGTFDGMGCLGARDGKILGALRQTVVYR